nr:iron export ABC transporter permease subunit FetB [Myxacorys almedinensis]
MGLVVAAIALSRWQRLGLVPNILIATGRAVLQLIVLGYVLSVVFAPPQSPVLILFVVAILLIVAAIVTRNRISQKLPRLLPWVIGSVLVSTALTVGYTQLLIVRSQPWYDPQFLIPLSGIVLSNAMNGATIAGERLVSAFASHQAEIETHLSLGATPTHAIAAHRRDAIRAGVLPTLNTMTIVGLATLPTVLSGQLLGGADPVSAIALEIIILIMLAFSTLVVTIALTSGICRQFFNDAAQLLNL